MNNNIIIWKRIEGYSNYFINKNGKIKNIKSGKILNGCKNSDGYIRVNLSKNRKGKTYSIHRLVAIAFIENPENKPMIDHINTIRNDNRLENLRWVTRSENMQNTIVYINNKLGIKNISIIYDNNNKYFAYDKTINGKRHTKSFKTLEYAIEYKNNYEINLIY